MISIWDATGRAQYVSPSHKNWLGHSCDYLQGELKEELFHPDDIAMVRESVQKILAGGEPSTIEYRLRHAQGHWLALEATLIPLYSTVEKKLMNFIVLARNITHSRETEERLRLTEKLLAVGELAAGVAHEIRNPLTTLKGFIQFIREGNESEMYLDLMESELNRIEAITNEFLLLAKPQVYVFKAVQAEQLMGSVYRLLIAQANLFNIELTVNVEPNLPMMRCEENALKQVFINLIKNAIESMPDGGRVVVEVKQVDEEYVQILVHDEGCGIEEERIARLGQPFYSRKEKGSGLGLMICSRIIKQHHGTIRFVSEVGKGTTVEINLPVFEGQD
ncbi:PAS domain-containing protein [Aneurinibacillus sp. BA2021]|nr:PAS domain-containing protein [Aneurinibacillus sp. BA2021]